MEPKSVTALAELAGGPLRGNAGARASGTSEEGSWFRALAEAWGDTLDNQAAKIEQLSVNMGENGAENPSSIIELTAESMRMQFLANSQATSTNSVGQAMETMARKQ